MKNIYVLDNEEKLTNSLTEVFKIDSGIKVTKVLLKYYKDIMKMPPDIIVIDEDVIKNDAKTIQYCKEIRSNEDNSITPIVMVSSNNNQDHIILWTLFDHTFHSKYLKKKIVSLIAVWARVYREAYFHATCNEEITGLEKYYAINPRNVYMVPNIPTTIEAEKKTIKKEKNELKVIFISRIVEKKNLLLAIKAVNKAKIKVQFDIYGPIESEEYWMRCKEEISHHGDNITIKYMGSLNPSDVKTVFMNYHVFIFPTFSENYGHVIAEALSMSCPIILTKNTTPWDDADGVAGYLASLDNLQGFVDAINKVGEMDQKEYDELLGKTGQYFNMKMNTDNAVQGHKEMFRKIIEDYQDKWKK